MGKVISGYSTSLDGFIAGPNDDVGLLFAWMERGEVELKLPMGHKDLVVKMSPQSAKQFLEMKENTGAIVSGRRLFDIAGAWGGRHPLDAPVVVVTHSIPEEWAGEDSPFIFVTDGVESAIATAREIAGDKDIGVGGANITHQCLKAGLLDEIQIDLVPVLLGSGIRFFEPQGIEPVTWERIRVIEGEGVTHLRFRVVR